MLRSFSGARPVNISPIGTRVYTNTVITMQSSRSTVKDELITIGLTLLVLTGLSRFKDQSDPSPSKPPAPGTVIGLGEDNFLIIGGDDTPGFRKLEEEAFARIQNMTSGDNSGFLIIPWRSQGDQRESLGELVVPKEVTGNRGVNELKVE